MSIVGVGIDSVDVDRIGRTLERTPGFLTRVLTVGEAAYSSGRPERVAVRFAAKEAVMKALGVGLGAFGFHEVEVVRHESGRPELKVSGRAEALAQAAGVARWHVSLTHTDRVATAYVVAEA